MSIASAITAAQDKVANAYTAVSNKGGTLPTAQNLSNLPVAINSIPSGGGLGHYVEKTVDANGKLENSANIINLNGITDIGYYALAYNYVDVSFPTNTNIIFPSLTSVSGGSACRFMFREGSGIVSVSFPRLTSITGNFAFQSAFQYQDAINSISMPLLTTVGGTSACDTMFANCTNLTNAVFPALTNITAPLACDSMFAGCTNLTSLAFPAITTTSFGTFTNQFQNLCRYIPNITLHFPSNVQSVIEGLTGYSATAPFGAVSGTVLFDLPATE